MNICHVITGLSTGGAETFLCRLLESLSPPEFTHSVIVLGRQGALSARIAKHATLHHLNMRAKLPLPRDFLWLRRNLQTSQPDLIHTWMYHANLMGTLAALGMQIPVLWGVRQSLYDIHHEKLATRLVIRINRMLSDRPTRIIYNSFTAADQHEKCGFSAERRQVIPNGFDTEVFCPNDDERGRVRAELGIGDDDLAIGLIARWHPMKDHANFLHAAVLLARSMPKTIFVLVGEGMVKENATITALVHSLGLENRVRLCGRRIDIAAFDTAFDIASSSSSWGEGFSNALAEAMACGTPCVATDVGDVREIIGDTGIVVPIRDPEAMSKGWVELAALGARGRMELGLRARARIIERYAMPFVADQYAQLYRGLVLERSAHAVGIVEG